MPSSAFHNFERYMLVDVDQTIEGHAKLNFDQDAGNLSRLQLAGHASLWSGFD